MYEYVIKEEHDPCLSLTAVHAQEFGNVSTQSETSIFCHKHGTIAYYLTSFVSITMFRSIIHAGGGILVSHTRNENGPSALCENQVCYLAAISWLRDSNFAVHRSIWA
jgi:hypothetical protein